ncbi:hypothetical protein TNCV_4318601 [Trichonephila clavipes]|nr:hypothetical protein TNCV_4318601 [Trichonephila clavipes]
MAILSPRPSLIIFQDVKPLKEGEGGRIWKYTAFPLSNTLLEEVKLRLVHFCPRAESDLRVSLVNNGLVGPYSATVLVTSFSPGSSTSSSRVRSLNLIFTIILRYRSVESDLRVSLVNNGLVGPYSATVLVTLPSAPDHRPPRLESAR